jgi:DNA-binding SARP family transcriptional activator/TolB-like protein
MIKLRILGPIDLRASDGSEIRTVIAQPKRLAILAYLSSRAGIFHRRDTLLALFWPELDQQRGRAALRQAIYHLRRALGPEVVVARGDDELGIDPAYLWCDAAAFRQAISEKRFQDAAELHRGDLLAGVYLDQTLELERWLDEERMRLRLSAAKAAWAAAEGEEQAGNFPAAATWARRAVEFGPDDEESARRLISLLARAGDHAGALRAYQDLTRRLEREYDAAPSAATRALITEIKTAVPVASTPPAPVPTERSTEPPGAVQDEAAQDASSADAPNTAMPNPGAQRPERSDAATIAVLPFTFTGKAELEYLGEGMADLLGLAICGTERLNCLDTRTLLTWFMKHGRGADGEVRADAELCREVGERFNADHCVLGGIVHAGDRLRAQATLYAVGAPEEPLLRVTAESGVDEPLALADRLAAQLLVQGVGAPPSELARIAALTTDSLPALKSYLNGEQNLRAGRFTPAVEAFQQAVLEDPDFSLAHYRIAALAEWAGLIPLARTAAANALRGADRLPVNDRRLLEALHAYVEGDIERAERLYQEIVAVYPKSTEAWANLAKLGYFLNSLRGRRFIEAAEPLERARALDPDNIITLVHLANVAAKEGRLEELDALIDRVLQLQHGADYTDYPLILKVLRAFTLTEPDDRASIWEELESGNEFTLFWSFTILTMLVGDLGAASRVAELMTHPSRPREVQLYGRLIRAELEVARGSWDRANVELGRASRLDPQAATIHKALLALLEYREPEADELRALRDELSNPAVEGAEPEMPLALWFTAHARILEPARKYFLGLVHLRFGEWDAAEGLAAELERHEGDFAEVAYSRDAACGIRARLALHRDRDPGAALGWLERCRLAAPMYCYIPSPLFGRLHERYLRAELLALLGREAEAETWLAALGEDSPHGFIYLAASHLRRAGLHRARGELHEARVHHDRFGELWQGGDPEPRPVLEGGWLQPDGSRYQEPSPGAEAAPVPLTDPRAEDGDNRGERRRRRRGARGGKAWAALGAVGLLITALLVPRAFLRPERLDLPRIAVGAITDLTGSEDNGLAHALTGMLAMNFARLPGVEVVSEIRIHELLAQLGEDGVGDHRLLMQQAAVAAGAGQVLDGFLHRHANGGYRLDLRRVDLASGAARAAYAVQSDDLFSLADAAAASFATEFGLAAPSAGFAEVTTRSLVAYRFYQEGLREYYAGDRPRAGRLFEAAVEEDSTFAMAKYYASLAAPFPRSAELLLEAVHLARTASDRERLLIEAAWTAATDDPRRLALAETLAVRYPAEPAGHLFLGQAKLWSGDFMGAIPYLRQVVTMDSVGLGRSTAACHACDAFGEITTAYGMVDSLAAVKRVAQEWRKLQPLSPTPWIALAFALDSEGRTEEALAAVDSARQRQPGANYAEVRLTILSRAGAFAELEEVIRERFRAGGQAMKESALWSLALLQRTRGRPRDALETMHQLYRLAARPTTIPADLAFYQAAEAMALLDLGRAREAAALFERAAGVEIVNQSTARNARHQAWLLTHAAAAYAELGDTTRLEILADSIQRLGTLSAYGRDQRLHHHVRGLKLRVQGLHEAAIDEFRRAIFSPVAGYTRTNYELARALMETGRPEEAITTLEQALRGPIGASGYYLTTTELHELLARALISAGREADARHHLMRVYQAWRDGEPEYRVRAEEARQRLASRPDI